MHRFRRFVLGLSAEQPIGREQALRGIQMPAMRVTVERPEWLGSFVPAAAGLMVTLAVLAGAP